MGIKKQHIHKNKTMKKLRAIWDRSRELRRHTEEVRVWAWNQTVAPLPHLSLTSCVMLGFPELPLTLLQNGDNANQSTEWLRQLDRMMTVMGLTLCLTHCDKHIVLLLLNSYHFSYH